MLSLFVLLHRECNGIFKYWTFEIVPSELIGMFQSLKDPTLCNIWSILTLFSLGIPEFPDILTKKKEERNQLSYQIVKSRLQFWLNLKTSKYLSEYLPQELWSILCRCILCSWLVHFTMAYLPLNLMSCTNFLGLLK